MCGTCTRPWMIEDTNGAARSAARAHEEGVDSSLDLYHSPQKKKRTTHPPTPFDCVKLEALHRFYTWWWNFPMVLRWKVRPINLLTSSVRISAIATSVF